MSGWLATGKNSQLLAQQEEQEHEERKKGYKLPFRFFLGKGEQADITFIDGDLDEDGNLTPPRFYEHSIKVAGKLEHYICPQKTNPEVPGECPICQSGDRPSLVAVFTVIDHREVPSSDGKTVYKDRVRLLVAKPTGFDLLAFQAKKQGGLGCARFTVSRIGEKSSAIGDSFEFQCKEERQVLRNRYFRVVQATEEEIAAGKRPQYRKTNFIPVDYGEDFPYYTCGQLEQMGLGRAAAAPQGGFRGNGAQNFNSGNTVNDNYVPPSMQGSEEEINFEEQL